MPREGQRETFSPGERARGTVPQVSPDAESEALLGRPEHGQWAAGSLGAAPIVHLAHRVAFRHGAINIRLAKSGAAISRGTRHVAGR